VAWFKYDVKSHYDVIAVLIVHNKHCKCCCFIVIL